MLFRVTRANARSAACSFFLPRLGTKGGRVNFDLGAMLAGNGTLIERVTAPDSVFTNIGSGFGSSDLASWV